MIIKENFPEKLITGLLLILINSTLSYTSSGSRGDEAPGVSKIKDVVIYENGRFYCAFPSVVKRPDGELIVAFRRAPDRKVFSEKNYIHVDANSYLVLVRSRDRET